MLADTDNTIVAMAGKVEQTIIGSAAAFVTHQLHRFEIIPPHAPMYAQLSYKIHQPDPSEQRN
jgi:hypothetical protein